MAWMWLRPRTSEYGQNPEANVVTHDLDPERSGWSQKRRADCLQFSEVRTIAKMFIVCFFNEMKCLFIENKWFICKYVLLTAIFVNETRGNTIFYYKPVKFYSSHIINMTGHMTGHVFGHVICCFLKCIFKYCELFFDKS